MPTKLVVESLDHLLPVITKMINSSLLGGHFPKVWKEALIDPRYKKAGINDFTNLRPVSNLQYVSKLVEHAVFDQVHAHLSEHDLYPLFQSAYRRGHNTETALLKIYNDIALEWFASYLSGRSQRFSLSGKCSGSLQLNQGVPQGSCFFFVFLLFTLYASKLFEVVKRHLPSVHAYADDTQ